MKKESRPESDQERSSSRNIIAVIILVILVGSLVFIFANDSNREKGSAALVSEVQAELNKLDEETKSSLASTSHKGDIVSVEPAVSGGAVEVNVSTYFESPDEGKTIARNIFNSICSSVPGLNSLYVISSSSGLESHSIYRSESACS